MGEARSVIPEIILRGLWKGTGARYAQRNAQDRGQKHLVDARKLLMGWNEQGEAGTWD